MEKKQQLNVITANVITDKLDILLISKNKDS